MYAAIVRVWRTCPCFRALLVFFRCQHESLSSCDEEKRQLGLHNDEFLAEVSFSRLLRLFCPRIPRLRCAGNVHLSLDKSKTSL